MDPPNRLDKIETSLSLYLDAYYLATKRRTKLPTIAPLLIEDAVWLLDQAHHAETMKLDLKKTKEIANISAEKYIKLLRKRNNK